MAGVHAMFGSKKGVAPTPYVTLAPTEQNTTATTATYDFAAEVATVHNGTPTAYNWSVSGSPGTWSILSGQGTNTAVVRVQNATNTEPVYGTVTCTATVNSSPYSGSANLTYTRT